MAIAGIALALFATVVATTQSNYITPAAADAARGTARGELVSAKHLLSLSRGEAAKELDVARFDSGSVRHGVDTYRIVYRTIDPEGQPTTASGLLALPRSNTRRLTTVSYLHGTEFTKDDAPSVQEHGGDPAPAITYASAGFAAVTPDYLGLGVGPGFHPWLDVPSETTAALDMLRAARRFAPRTDHVLRREVMVTGFSQGGPAAMGLARALQEPGTPRWRLGAVAPISGPYDLRDAEIPAVLDGELDPISSVAYTAYLVVAWNRLHGLYNEPGEMIRAPYDRGIEDLFDGMHTTRQLFKHLPATVDELLTPRTIELFRNPTGPFAEALEISDATCADWAPRAPVRLYVASRDREVTVANSESCQAELHANGVDAPIVNVGPVDHLASNGVGTAMAVRWFISLD
jgi:hypothetical protein